MKIASREEVKLFIVQAPNHYENFPEMINYFIKSLKLPSTFQFQFYLFAETKRDP
jgi:hypothetical protein